MKSGRKSGNWPQPAVLGMSGASSGRCGRIDRFERVRADSGSVSGGHSRWATSRTTSRSGRGSSGVPGKSTPSGWDGSGSSKAMPPADSRDRTGSSRNLPGEPDAVPGREACLVPCGSNATSPGAPAPTAPPGPVGEPSGATSQSRSGPLWPCSVSDAGSPPSRQPAAERDAGECRRPRRRTRPFRPTCRSPPEDDTAFSGRPKGLLAPVSTSASGEVGRYPFFSGDQKHTGRDPIPPVLHGWAAAVIET